MKLSRLFGLSFVLFSLPVLAECPTQLICSEGIMDKIGRCHSCNSTYKIQACDMDQAKKNCPNRFIDQCKNSKLKCDDNEEAIGHNCLPICENGLIRNERGECCHKNGGICRGSICAVDFYDHGVPFFIHNEDDAKNFICNDGVMNWEGVCHHCQENNIIIIYAENSEKAEKNCPNRVIDECRCSKLKCAEDEEQIGKRCYLKCPEGFVRNKNNKCCNPNTNECQKRDCPAYL